MENVIKKLEDDLSSEYDSEEMPPIDIVAYNELRSCADLFRLQSGGKLDIKPDFQRNIVWTDADQTRFIDSLSKQLPIPSMCLSLDNKTQEWKVVDGLQRMATIVRFFQDPNWKLSNLQDIDKDLRGKTPDELKRTKSVLYSRIENVSLPITILRCDYSKKDHLEYIFIIFRRLNEGGLKLNNQEIRNAVYQGNFNTLLKELDLNKKWRSMLGIKEKNKDRLKKAELILRFFAFFNQFDQYNGKLAAFLNEYMFKNRNLEQKSLEEMKELFESVVSIIEKSIEKNKLKSVSNVVLESLMFGISKNLTKVSKKEGKMLQKDYEMMLKSKPFSEENIREGIYKKEKVKARLEEARKIFS